MRQTAQKLRFLMFEVCNRPKCRITCQVSLHNTIPFSQGSKHDHCSLTMPDIMYFLLGDIANVLECSREIIFGHLVKAKLPKLFNFRVQKWTTVVVSSTIANPNIIPLVCKNKARGQVFIIDYPRVRWVLETVLEVYYFLFWLYFGVFGLESEEF